MGVCFVSNHDSMTHAYVICKCESQRSSILYEPRVDLLKEHWRGVGVEVTRSLTRVSIDKQCCDHG